jgi:hypothetical protein
MAITRLGGANAISGVIPVANGGSGRTAVTGNVLQVVTNTATTRFETTSTSYVAATGYTVAITPSAASSKVFVTITGGGGDSKASGRILYATLYRTISGGSATDIIGNSIGIAQVYGDSSRVQAPVALSALDSPNTTSAVTYQVYIKNYDGQVGFNNNEGETQLTAFEIAG